MTTALAIPEIVEVLDAEPKVRWSYKYRIIPETSTLHPDFVFASSPEEALERARDHYKISTEEAVEVLRVSDQTNLALRLN